MKFERSIEDSDDFCADKLRFVSSTEWTGSVRSGFTIHHASPPSAHRIAATRKEAVQPNRSAIQGVSEAVSAPPNCPPVFMNPETEPEEVPAMPEVTDQNELWER
jgi:hypothetical protein